MKQIGVSVKYSGGSVQSFDGINDVFWGPCCVTLSIVDSNGNSKTIIDIASSEVLEVRSIFEGE